MRTLDVSSFVFVAVLGGILVSSANVNAAGGPLTSGWRPLFNGTNLNGWSIQLRGQSKNEDPARLVQVKEGALHFYPDAEADSAQPFGYIATEEEYTNYRLRLEFKWGGKKFAPRARSRRDSGVLYHVTAQDKVWPDSVEYQIQEKDVGDIYTVSTRVTAPVDPKTTNLNVTISTNRTTGVIRTNQNVVPVFREVEKGGVLFVQGAVGPSLRVVRQGLHEREGWNVVEIEVHASRAAHSLNGNIVNGCGEMQQSIDGDWAPLNHGRIALQLEGAEILYRNIELQELKE